ncbi:MAG TPA: hypothetical protein VNL94_05125 [Candidatus Binatia bacterium]|nr:hypothetical protein [Candidatus Binatia bacterium]
MLSRLGANRLGAHQVGRREALISAGVVFLVALVVRAWAATQITFPRPEDVAYYVGVSRNLLEGRGFVSDAIWSFQTPPLSFPRPAFEVWLPLPSILAAVPMALFGHTFAAAQVSSIVVGSLVCALAWRLAADVAAARSMPIGRARTLALGAGLTSAVYLPLVLASVQPDSTMPFALLVLLGCLLITRYGRRISLEGVRAGDLEAFVRRAERLVVRRSRVGLAIAVVLGLAAMTRNEAIWLAAAFAIIEWSNARSAFPRWSDRLGAWVIRVVPVGFFAFLVFSPWALRDWVVFGSPFPGQALVNALSLQGTDIFAWQDRPTLERYLAAGPVRLLELRWIGAVHNLTQVLLFLGVPLSIVGLIGLPAVMRWRSKSTAAGVPVDDPLRPLVLFSIITFLVASLVFPVSTTWGTFLHAAGAIHVLLVISALLALDWLIGWVGRRRGWTNPVAWLGPAFAIAGCLLFTLVLLRSDGEAARAQARRYEALGIAFSGVDATGRGVDLASEPGPVITDFPIWFAETTRHPTLALPNESISSVLDLARSFNPPAELVVFDPSGDGRFPSELAAAAPGSECFVPVELPDPASHPGALEDFVVFRIRCP